MTKWKHACKSSPNRCIANNWTPLPMSYSLDNKCKSVTRVTCKRICSIQSWCKLKHHILSGLWSLFYHLRTFINKLKDIMSKLSLCDKCKKGFEHTIKKILPIIGRICEIQIYQLVPVFLTSKRGSFDVLVLHTIEVDSFEESAKVRARTNEAASSVFDQKSIPTLPRMSRRNARRLCALLFALSRVLRASVIFTTLMAASLAAGEKTISCEVVACCFTHVIAVSFWDIVCNIFIWYCIYLKKQNLVILLLFSLLFQFLWEVYRSLWENHGHYHVIVQALSHHMSRMLRIFW